MVVQIKNRNIHLFTTGKCHQKNELKLFPRNSNDMVVLQNGHLFNVFSLSWANGKEQRFYLISCHVPWSTERKK